MPKIKKKLTPQEKMQLSLQNVLNEISIKTDLNNAEIARALGISEVTLWRRKNNPEDLTVCQLKRLALLADRNVTDFVSEFVR